MRNLLTITDAANFVYHRPKTIRNWLSLGLVRRHKISGRTMVERSELLKLFRNSINGPLRLLHEQTLYALYRSTGQGFEFITTACTKKELLSKARTLTGQFFIVSYCAGHICRAK